jgi:hypothetical protein
MILEDAPVDACAPTKPTNLPNPLALPLGGAGMPDVDTAGGLARFQALPSLLSTRTVYRTHP